MEYLEAFEQHLMLVIVSLAISFVLAIAISYILLKLPRAQRIVENLFGAIYSVPSLALFALMIPVTGLGDETAIIALVIYNQYLLIRNILAGINGIDKSILEAGTGMGMSQGQIFSKVILPLAAPSIIAGVRLSVVSTTGIATIAASINVGGLGIVLFSGMRTMDSQKIFIGTLLCIVIAFVADIGIKCIENKIDWRVRVKNEL